MDYIGPAPRRFVTIEKLQSVEEQKIPAALLLAQEFSASSVWMQFTESAPDVFPDLPWLAEVLGNSKFRSKLIEGAPSRGIHRMMGGKGSVPWSPALKDVITRYTLATRPISAGSSVVVLARRLPSPQPDLEVARERIYLNHLNVRETHRPLFLDFDQQGAGVVFISRLLHSNGGSDRLLCVSFRPRPPSQGTRALSQEDQRGGSLLMVDRPKNPFSRSSSQEGGGGGIRSRGVRSLLPLFFGRAITNRFGRGARILSRQNTSKSPLAPLSFPYGNIPVSVRTTQSSGHPDAMAGVIGGGAVVAVLPEPEKSDEPLTLAEGITRAFDLERGIYPRATRHTRDSKTLAERAVKVLGKKLTWAELTPGKILYLVRTLARSSTDGTGARSAEYTCVVLYAVAAWLRQEQLIPESAAVPSRGWKAKVKEEWRAITGRRVETHRPRHSVEEVAAIFAALPHGDPRLRLLIELAAELRAGQAVRGKRSDLDLGRTGGFGLGRFVVHGAGKKHGEVVDLHPELRALVDGVLSTGYLVEVEAAYGRGEIEDYFLFPAGKLRRGIVPVERATRQPLDKTAIRKMFVDVE